MLRIHRQLVSFVVVSVVVFGLLSRYEPIVGLLAQQGENSRAALLARASEAELDTDYVAPPGDPLAHHISGFAKTLCSAVFVTGLDADFAAESVGFFSGPYEYRDQVVRREIDNDGRRVHLTLPNGVVRTAKLNGDHGCVTLPIGADDVFFDPVDIRSNVPAPDATAWPMGDVLPDTPFADEIDLDKVSEAIDAAFVPAHSSLLTKDELLASDMARGSRCIRHSRVGQWGRV